MKLYLLKLINQSRTNLYDYTFGLVICAESEQRAREIEDIEVILLIDYNPS